MTSNPVKAKVRQYIRTTVAAPEYFSLGQIGQVNSIIVDDDTPDGYAYYIDFGLDSGETEFWFLDSDEFELYEGN